MQKLRKLNLVKTGLKSKFGVIFSHELCLYITRFGAPRAGKRGVI